MLKSIEDLMVYKKNLESRMVGLRWSYSENTNLVGFIISFDEDALTTKSQNVTIIPPTKCSTWPNYYCHILNNLSASGNYTFKVSIKSSNDYGITYIFTKYLTFKVKPKTSDYPDGVNASSITFNISGACK